jgi:hypothetical protein
MKIDTTSYKWHRGKEPSGIDTMSLKSIMRREKGCGLISSTVIIMRAWRESKRSIRALLKSM